MQSVAAGGGGASLAVGMHVPESPGQGNGGNFTPAQGRTSTLSRATPGR